MKSAVALHMLLVLQASFELLSVAAKGHNSNKGLLWRTPVNSKLDPDSHKLFFGKDYPDDEDASKHEPQKFGHPYPALQDTSDYDKDYVKDENNDDGEWKAQMTYDLLRTKITKAKEEYRKTQQNAKEIRAQVDAAQKNEANAAQATRDAEARAAKAKWAVESAEEAYRRLQGGGASGSGKGNAEEKNAQAEVDAAMDKVKKEIKDLGGCREELEAAREQLKELLAKEDAQRAEANRVQAEVKFLVKQNATRSTDQTKQQQQALLKSKEGTAVDGWGKEARKHKITDEGEQKELQQGEADAQAAVLEAHAREFEAEEARQKAQQTELARKAADEETRHREAQVKIEEQKRDFKHTSDELDKAALKLKAFRRNGDKLVRPGGGNIRSGAMPANLASLLSLLVMPAVTLGQW